MEEQHLVDIIIPTYNNQEYLGPCLQSLTTSYVTEGLYKIIVVNNGHKNSCDFIAGHPMITVIQAGSNLGWEGGLNEGLKISKAPFVCFVNDDTFVPTSQRLWLNNLLELFRDEKLAAIGPSTNVVMGMQNMFYNMRAQIFQVMYLIGFFMLVRRSALDEVGGVDMSLPGGDDLDLSIRLRKAGYKLLVNRDVFVFHHGFKTGERVYGGSSSNQGWNSYEQWYNTNTALIKKHGLKAWYECILGNMPEVAKKADAISQIADSEGEAIRKEIVGEKILDLGCGAKKTVENAVGVDIIAKGELIHTLVDKPKSDADVVANITLPLPFPKDSQDTIIARHILEHVIDPIEVMTYWKKVLKKGGRLIIAVPNQRIINSIPLNSEHVHAFIPSSLKNLLKKVGFKVVKELDPNNHISFVTIAEKV